MNEHGYIEAVNKKVTATNIWKICDKFQAGIPDCHYEGLYRDWWIEYKFIAEFPKRECTLIDPSKMLTALQKYWIERRLKIRQDVWVVVGSPKGGVIFKDLDWKTPLTSADFLSRAKDKSEIAKAISDTINQQ